MARALWRGRCVFLMLVQQVDKLQNVFCWLVPLTPNLRAVETLLNQTLSTLAAVRLCDKKQFFVIACLKV